MQQNRESNLTREEPSICSVTISTIKNKDVAVLNETNTRRTGVDENLQKGTICVKPERASKARGAQVHNVIATSATSEARMIREI